MENGHTLTPGTQPESDLDPADVQAVTTALLTASRLLVAISARSLAAINDHITVAQFRMLVVISVYPRTNLVDLAQRLEVNPSTAMRMADRLIGSGLLRKTANPGNRREMMVDITHAGRKVVDDVTRQRHAEIANIVARMPATERTNIIRALTAFTQAGDEPPAQIEPTYPLGWQ